MKKLFIVLGLSFGLFVSSASSDELTNSLNNMVNKKEKSMIVNLDHINLDGKPKPKVPKTRSKKAVVATINGKKIIKRDADSYLKSRTKGKMKNFDHLAKKQRKQLINEIGYPIILSQQAKKELSQKEIDSIIVRTWMQKEASTIRISDDEALAVYSVIEQQAKDTNRTDELIPFETIKNKIKGQMVEKRILGKLMKDAEINIL